VGGSGSEDRDSADMLCRMRYSGRLWCLASLVQQSQARQVRKSYLKSIHSLVRVLLGNGRLDTVVSGVLEMLRMRTTPALHSVQAATV